MVSIGNNYYLAPRFPGAIQLARLVIVIYLFFTISLIFFTGIVSLGFWNPRFEWTFGFSERIANVFVKGITIPERKK